MQLAIRNGHKLSEWNEATYTNDSLGDIQRKADAVGIALRIKVGEKSQIQKELCEIPHLYRTNPSV